MNFIEQVVQGSASISEIYEEVEFWHTHETGNSLKDFLGLTEKEMKLLLYSDTDDVLEDIVYCRRNNIY
ncbi:hypothetical protein [Caproiciproducens sp.]|uniref:hypothetical protein n=1 Tax=Caproiciproducens sp. TaxID=1954376 RepID=UPI002899DD62|nr:hypothetical protein [Caproiciproducens sp.]